MKSHAVFERGTLAPIPFLESDPVYTIHKGKFLTKLRVQENLNRCLQMTFVGFRKESEGRWWEGRVRRERGDEKGENK